MLGSAKVPVDLLLCARKLKMFAPGAKVLVAVSGGADSVAMLHALFSALTEFQISLHVCHINHRIRETAQRDKIFVEEFCKSLGLPCTVCEVDIPSLISGGGGVEETARNARYRLLAQTAELVGASQIAVGHTVDDVVETLLYNLVRGTGIEGLGSIKPVRGKIVRPILDACRADVETYLIYHKLDFMEDETNADISYTRNRIRHELIPYLQKHFNPAVKLALNRLAAIAENSQAYISSQTRLALDRLRIGEGFDAAQFQQLDTAVKYELIRQQIAAAKGSPTDISYDQVQRVVDALDSDENIGITLPSGAVEVRRIAGAFFFRSVAAPLIEPYSIELFVPGSITLPNSNTVISASIVPKPPNLRVSSDTALLDSEKVRGSLTVRNPLPGDRIVPFGMTGTKKLQDVFVDNHIPARERGGWQVIVDSEKILWVASLVASNECRITESTTQVIELKISEKKPL